MTGNISKDDRIIRIVIGLGFLSMIFMGPETQWGWVGLIPLVTAAIGFCPLYKQLGFNTKKAAGEDQSDEEASSDDIKSNNKEAGAAS